MLYSLLFALVLAGSASTQVSTRFQAIPAELPTYQVLRTDQGIQVDGRLDEADWQRAAPIAFVMPWSDLEKEEPQSTTARLLWDDDNLYIIYECVDPYLHSEVTEHDGAVYQEDAVEIFATPNMAVPGNYYGYEMNINGTLLDYIAFRGGKERTKAIHSSWQSEGVVIATTYDGTLNDHSDTDQSWILEISIPSRQLPPLGWTNPTPRRRPMARRTQPHQGLPRPIWAVVRYRHTQGRLPPRHPVRHPHLFVGHRRPLKGFGSEKRRKAAFSWLHSTCEI